MSLNIYNKATKKLEQAAGRVADAYTKDQADAKLADVKNLITKVWNSATSYAIGDYCLYNDKLWKALLASKNVTPSESTYWHECNAMEEVFTLSNKLTQTEENMSSYISGLTHAPTLTIENGYCTVAGAIAGKELAANANVKIGTLPSKYIPNKSVETYSPAIAYERNTSLGYTTGAALFYITNTGDVYMISSVKNNSFGVNVKYKLANS